MSKRKAETKDNVAKGSKSTKKPKTPGDAEHFLRELFTRFEPNQVHLIIFSDFNLIFGLVTTGHLE